MFKRKASFLIAAFLIAALVVSAGLVLISPQQRARQQDKKIKEELAKCVDEMRYMPEGASQKQELRKKVIALVQTLRTPPAIPEGVLEHEGRAEAAVRNAKTPEDYMAAAEEYKEAICLAPWVPSYYYNLGLVLEKAGKPSDAIDNLNLYLLAAPDAQDAGEVKKKIAGLEFEMQAAARARAAEAEQERADENLARQLVGIWSPPPVQGRNFEDRRVEMKAFCRMRIESTGKEVHATCIGVPATNEHLTSTWYDRVDLPYIEGTIEKGRLIGTKNNIWYAYDGAGLSGSEPYDAKIDMAYDGMSFTEIQKNEDERVWIKE